MKKQGSSFLIFVLLLSIGLVLISEKYSFIKRERKDSALMYRASALASEWFDIISRIKKEKGLLSPESENLKYPGLIGLEYSEITTTLGSLDAKYTANNPEFAALTVKFLSNAGIDSTSTVGVISSGSFPSLVISTLAAIQTLGAKVILISSLGASSYGANDPNATWIDMEKWLRENGGLKYRSSIVTLGAENDNGLGLQDDGIVILEQAALRCGVTLFRPETYVQSLNTKLDLLTKGKIKLLINIGGNQVAIGKCPHGSAISNGFHKKLNTCHDSDRGLIFRLSEKGTPVLHYLNIKSLAAEYGLPIAPSQYFSKPEIIYLEKVPERPYSVLALLIITCSFLLNGFIKTRKENQKNKAMINNKSLNEK
jgi:poly-gamma-glutamate system protein